MWARDRETGMQTTTVKSREITRISSSTGCLLHDCPGCANIWTIFPYNPSPSPPVIFRTSMVQKQGEMVRVISDARLPGHCWCGVPFPSECAVQLSKATAIANVHLALKTALTLSGEDSNVVDEIQILSTKVTSSMLRKLRGERRKRGTATS